MLDLFYFHFCSWVTTNVLVLLAEGWLRSMIANSYTTCCWKVWISSLQTLIMQKVDSSIMLKGLSSIKEGSCQAFPWPDLPCSLVNSSIMQLQITCRGASVAQASSQDPSATFSRFKMHLLCCLMRCWLMRMPPEMGGHMLWTSPNMCTNALRNLDRQMWNRVFRLKRIGRYFLVGKFYTKTLVLLYIHGQPEQVYTPDLPHTSRRRSSIRPSPTAAAAKHPNPHRHRSKRIGSWWRRGGCRWLSLCNRLPTASLRWQAVQIGRSHSGDWRGPSEWKAVAAHRRHLFLLVHATDWFYQVRIDYLQILGSAASTCILSSCVDLDSGLY
jgi:hypothetical protein